MDKLQKRLHILVNGYPLCLAAKETADHLLIHYSFASKVWTAIFYKFKMCWVMPRSVSELSSQVTNGYCRIFLYLLSYGNFG